MARRKLPVVDAEEYIPNRFVALTPVINELLNQDAPVAIGVSGGKDSSAVAIAVVTYLRELGHKGTVLLIHADLGATEWEDSLPMCRKLAKFLDVELVVVKRPQGDMMERWEQRWRDNVKRWEELSCVKIILPWSTPAMRFCTAELKIDQICRYLSKRFNHKVIVSVTGIRHDESTDRQNAPISAMQPKLSSKTRDTAGYTWNAIANWKLRDVLDFAVEQGFPLHEAYTKFGADRVSCVYCMLAGEKNHKAAMADQRTHSVGIRTVKLEIQSTFAFQGNRWLGDTLNDILEESTRVDLVRTKERAKRREEAEAKIPEHLLYCKGWPTCVPTFEEAKLLGEVRVDVALAVGLNATFIKPKEIVARYEHLLAEKAKKDKKGKPA